MVGIYKTYDITKTLTINPKLMQKKVNDKQ